MKNSIHSSWLLGLLLAWWAARPAGAQAPGPGAGGAPLREVTRLARVAEPPGSLIPYRAGRLWGYADTTGRVVIRPCLDARQGAPAVFFTQGFALTKQYAIADCLPAPSEEPYRLVVLNARGEVLRVRGWQAAVAQPDGSLRLVPRWQAYGQLELAQLDSAASSGFSDSGLRRVVPARLDQPEPGPGDSVGYQPRLLGAHRGTRANKYTGARMPRERSPDHSGRWLGLYALTDRQGRLLTSYQFVSVDSFYEGRARVVLPEWHLALTRAQRRAHYADDNPASTAPAYGYIDTTGTLIYSGFGSVFRHGRAVVSPSFSLDSGTGIIDPLGRYQLPLQPYALSEPDEAGFVRLYGPAHGPNSIHYLAPPGQPGFAAQAFARAGPFVQGRARARQGARAGLLDVAGHWVTRRAYEVLLSPASLGPGRFRAFSEEDADYRDYDLEFATPTGLPHLPAAPPYRETTAQDLYQSWPDFLAPRFPAADPAYLVARRRGKYGLVARRSGRETVPARYDSVRFNPCRGLVCLWRAGRSYVVEAATGRALAGAYGGIDFLTPQGERLRYLTRAAPAAWALLDTLGHLRTPWIPGTGYPTPQGWLLSHEPHAWTLRDAAGRLAYSAPGPICQPQWSQLWADVKKVYDEQEPATKRFVSVPYWQLPLALHNPAVRGAFVVTDSLTHTLRLLDAHLRELGQVPAAGTSPLAGGWLARLAPTGAELYTDTGQRLPAPPPGTTWLGPGYLYAFDYARAWRTHGVVPTAQGYVTRGGRQLWEE